MKHEPSVDKFIKIAKSFISEQSIRTIIEIGARDCCETLRFKGLLPNAIIYTFECNPDTPPFCRKNVQELKNVYLIEKAVTNFNGIAKFHQIDTKKTETTWQDGNPGASSLLKASGNYPVENYVQNEIKVESITLKTFLQQSNTPPISIYCGWIFKVQSLWLYKDLQRK